jgi:broad-specificity NMP kinase
MFDECPGCGEVHTEMPVDETGSVVRCPNCEHEEPLHREPLLVVSGAGGTGKSAVLRELRGTREDVVLLDSDVLWREELWDDFEWFFGTWLRLCRDVAQSGRPPVLFGAGFGVPDNLEAHAQFDCFSRVEYLVLVCDDGELERRLRNRPPGRHPGEFDMDDDAVAEQVEFNQWLRETAEKREFRAVDTTDATVEATAERVDEWITTRVDGEGR